MQSSVQTTGAGTHPTKVLIHCGNGYMFNDIYTPLIERQGDCWEITILLSKYNIAEATLDTVNRLAAKKKIASCHFVPIPDKKILLAAFKYHQSIWTLTRALSGKGFNLFVLGSDIEPTDRYLIELARSEQARVVVLQTSTLHMVVEYTNSTRMQSTAEKLKASYLRLMQCDSNVDKLRAIYRFIANRLKKLNGFGIRKLRVFQNYYLFPWMLTHRVFTRNQYDRSVFTAGRADAVICYGALEAEALEHFVPVAKKIYLAKNPLDDLCRCKGEADAVLKTKLLVAFSGNLTTELEGKQFERWISTIHRAVDLTKAEEVHLRPHPRTSKAMTWPQRLLDRVRQFNCSASIQDALKVSLADIICDYMGVISAPSGTLKVARAACKNIFAVALPYSGDEAYYKGEWLMGSTDGITLIREGEELGMHHLRVSKVERTSWPSVAEVLQRLLTERRGSTPSDVRNP